MGSRTCSRKCVSAKPRNEAGRKRERQDRGPRVSSPRTINRGALLENGRNRQWLKNRNRRPGRAHSYNGEPSAIDVIWAEHARARREREKGYEHGSENQETSVIASGRIPNPLKPINKRKTPKSDNKAGHCRKSSDA